VSPAYDVHPEFGYLCLAPRVRRELRVALVSLVLGMMIGAAIVTIRAGHAIETDGVSSHAQLRSSGSDTLAPGVAGPSSEFKIADNTNASPVKANPVEAIEPYPMRMVRVRPGKAASPLAGIPLGHTAATEAPASAGPAAPENAEASASPAAPPPAQSVAAGAEPAVSGTKKRPSAIHARRHRDDENENARGQNWRAPSWGERAYAEGRNWRGEYRNWVY
jgi:hypothetical protein